MVQRGPYGTSQAGPQLRENTTKGAVRRLASGFDFYALSVVLVNSIREGPRDIREGIKAGPG